MQLNATSIFPARSTALIRRAERIAASLPFARISGERALGSYLTILGHHGANTTLPVSGVFVQRHRDLVRYLSDRGVEFAVLGAVHADQRGLSDQPRREQIAKSLDAFAEAGIAVNGFRAPFLHLDQGTLAALEHLGFDYVSHEAVSYDVLDEDAYSASAWDRFRSTIDQRAVSQATDLVVRPRMHGRLVEIPVAMPDDACLIDQLGIVDGEAIGQIWTKLLAESYQRGDVLTLQVHPYRGSAPREALALTLGAALDECPSIWITQLRDVAAWWRLRDRCRLQVMPTGVRQWRVTVADDPRLTILVRNMLCPRAMEWDDRYRVIDGNSCLVEGPVCPVIGISSQSESLSAFLREEGYPIQVGADPSNCSIYLDHPGVPTPSEQAALVDEIEASPAPLVRLGRWPDATRSALAIVGNIGAASPRDFVSRLWGVLSVDNG